MDYVLHVVVLCSIYVVLAVSLHLAASRTGLLSVAHAAFFGLGAYTSALLTLHFRVSFPVALVASIAVGLAFSSVLVVAIWRLVDDYFMLAALGFQIVVQAAFSNWSSVTGGPLGISDIPAFQFGYASWSTLIRTLMLSGALAATCVLVVWAISSSSFGLVLEAVREDEIQVQSQGKNPRPFKALVLALSAAFAAAAGSVFAQYISYIDPSSFTVTESIAVLSMVIIGGGRLYGPIIGAILLVVLPELLRFVGMPSGAVANLLQVVYGVSLITLLILRPSGLSGKHASS